MLLAFWTSTLEIAVVDSKSLTVTGHYAMAGKCGSPAGLAIDVGLLHKRDGQWISVARDFQGKIGARTCGEGAHMPENPVAVELRALVCESADQGVFTYVLTPDYKDTVTVARAFDGAPGEAGGWVDGEEEGRGRSCGR